MTVVDEFCEFYFNNPGDVYAKYSEFIDKTGYKMKFKEYVDCIDTVSRIRNTEEKTLKKFYEFMEVRNGKEKH